MDQDEELTIKELLPIHGIGDKRALALAGAGITLENLPKTEPEAIREALKLTAAQLTLDTINDWKAEASALWQLYSAVREILGSYQSEWAHVPNIQVEVLAELHRRQIPHDSDDLDDKVNEVYRMVVEKEGIEPPDENGNGGNEGENGMDPQGTLFARDILAGNKRSYRSLQERVHILERKQKDQDGKLEPDLKQELIAAEAILSFSKPKLIVDPLFKAVQAYQRSCHHEVPDPGDGVFGFDPDDDNEGVLTLIAMYGIMQRENQTQPVPSQQFPDSLALACEYFDEDNPNHDTVRYQKVRATLIERGFSQENVCGIIADRPISQRFSNALALAQAEYNRHRDLFKNVFEILRNEDSQRAIDGQKWARVTSVLVRHGIHYEDPLLAIRAREALAGQISADEGGFPSGIAIDLPDLEAQTDVEIIDDNLHAMQAIYFSAMLDDANVFAVRDALMNNFRSGLLPFGRGRAGDLLYRMIKEVPNRLSEYDRRNLYARTLGFAGGDVHGMVNRDFQMLWLRFVSAVSTFARQLSVDSLVKGGLPMRVRQEQVKKAGRDLAANLSLYGFGATYFAATELQQQINEMMDLLSDDEVKLAYGARDMWGVVEQVSALELGGPRDSIRYRTMASAGAIVIRWLANQRNRLADVGSGNILDVNEILRPRVRPLGSKPTINPFDSDLINACERWLAVTGTPERQVEDYAGASEGPIQTSQPVRIPSIARDMLDTIGVNGSTI